MKFTKKFLQYLIVDNNNQAELIEDTIIGVDINRNYHMMIFKYKNRLYRKYYNCNKSGVYPLPLEYDNNKIECEEVIIVEKIMTVYENIKESVGR